MAFIVKKRGKLTYYTENEDSIFSVLVTEEQANGDLKIHFSGLTGGYSAKGILGLDELVEMDPEREIPLVFRCWEKWLQDAGICDSIAQIDFLEVHAFGCQPKSPNPLLDPAGFAAEQQRLYDAYRRAYAGWFKEHCPDNGLPARFTVHVVDVPDKAASYEFYSTGIYQQERHESPLTDTEPSKIDVAAAVRQALREMDREELKDLLGEIIREPAFASADSE